MRPRYWLVFLLALGAVLAAGFYPQHRLLLAPRVDMPAPAATSFLVLLGVGDKAATTWDGSVAVTGGQVLAIQGWRFGGKDSTDNKSTWKISTRTSAGSNTVMTENGVVITVNLADPAAQFAISTAQGEFSFSAQDVGYGSLKSYLKGRAIVDRVPPTLQLTSSIEDEDFPAAAQSGDTVSVAYVQFAHGDRSGENVALKTAPANFDWLGRPPGGDQVFLIQYSKSKRAWTNPVAVSDAGQDIMRAAVAVDGQGRVWVFWSANQQGNFDLYAKYLAGGKWSYTQRITWDPGTDLNPVAATDSAGRIWLAWQGYRNGNLEILAAVEQGDSFSAEATVSFSNQSDWDAAIAAAPNGDIAISWDTYDKGDYDVYFRRLRFAQQIQMDDPVAVAVSPNFEARSSIAFDAQNRLWVAYETSGPSWGKNFGAYASTGVALYQGHNLQVACFQGNSPFLTAADVTANLPGPANGAMFPRRFGPGVAVAWPNPDAAPNRAPNGGTAAPNLPANSMPRLAVDTDGKVYLAYRTSNGNGTSSIASIWHSEVVYYDGSAWSTPAIVASSDGFLDNRPALVPLAASDLLIVGQTDHRQQPLTNVTGQAAINSDIYAAEFRLSHPQTALKLTAAPVGTTPPPSPQSQLETGQVSAMRNARINVGGRNLQMMRGEFHRHTEISGDGGHDGPLIDAYRYLIDAAYMDWVGCCDHDNGGGREYSWWIDPEATPTPTSWRATIVPMFAYERSVQLSGGASQRGVPQARHPAAAAPADARRRIHRPRRRPTRRCSTAT